MNVRRMAKAMLAGVVLGQPAYWAAARRRRAMAVLCYHRVHDGPDPFRLAVGPAEFDAQMRTLARSDTLVPVTAAEFEAIWYGHIPYGERVPTLVTFDDGYRDNLAVAAEILRRHGIPALLFVATGVLGGEVLWYDLVEFVFSSFSPQSLQRLARHCGLPHLGSGDATDPATWVRHLKALPEARFEAAHAALREVCVAAEPDARYMRASDLESWMEQGFSIGAHTRTHPRLSALDDRRAEREIAESKEMLEAITGTPVAYFAYPFGGAGDFTRRHSDLLAEMGFRLAFSTIPGGNRAGGDPFTIHRKCVHGGLFERPGRSFDPVLFHADVIGLGPDTRARARALVRGGRAARKATAR